MKLTRFFLIAMNMMWLSPLWADPAQMETHEKKLEQLQAARRLDDAHTRQAQDEFRKGTAERSDHAEQQVRDVRDLKFVDNQVADGKKEKTLYHQAYKESLQKYGPGDARSATAKQSWKKSQQAMGPLLQTRRTLRESVHQGDRLAHNENTILSVQQRTMDSNARYRAIDDRYIEKEEKNISDHQEAVAENNH